MKVKEPDFAVVMSLVWRQAPALLVLSFLANLLLFSAVYGLQVYDRVLPSGARDRLLWVTPATLVAIHHHHFSPQAGSKRSGFSISPR
jgi:ABC-type protease/lipase transport system fused ATPase/permease subunit